MHLIHRIKFGLILAYDMYLTGFNYDPIQKSEHTDC